VEFVVGAVIFATVVFAGLGGLSGSSASTRGEPDFWELLHAEGAQYQWFESLEDMSAASSVVIVGRIVSVTDGRVFNPEPEYGERGKVYYLAATVEVESVLHGSLARAGARSITVELFAPNVAAIPLIKESTPSETSIFFLLNKAVHPATAGLSRQDRASEAQYYEIMGEQAHLEDVSDKVSVSSAIGPDEFPQGLAGRPFADLVAEIRALP
jgi:hypothetical protein